jgi:signal transduction histidine kinase
MPFGGWVPAGSGRVLRWMRGPGCGARTGALNVDRGKTARSASLYRRVLPATLGGRLVVTVVLLSLTTAVVTTLVDWAFIAPHGLLDLILVPSLVSGLLAVAIGVTLGVLLTRVIRKPVERTVEHLKTRGYLAVEGAPYLADATLDDPTLPVEFRELETVVDDLLRHLSARQVELKDAIAKTEYAEESLALVVNESLESKIVMEDGRITIANPAAAAALGRLDGELMQRTLTEALEGTTVLDEVGIGFDAASLLESALEHSATVQLSRDGHAPRWYVFQAARHTHALHDRILITGQDVTEDRRLQLIRSEIVALISHDLRSPLAVVIGYLDLLRKPLADDERERSIDSARRNAGRMADLLEDLLSATRAEELLAPAALLPVDLASLAAEVVSSMAPTHSERPLLMDVECSPVVRGEEKRLRQLVVNLVTNAFKYAPGSEPVTVRVRCEAKRALLQVVDHGLGVPVEDRERIFERYARLPGPSANRPGVGLGLYIVRIISENHGGHATVDDTPGGGATVTIDLPLAGFLRDGLMILDEPEGCLASATAPEF